MKIVEYSISSNAVVIDSGPRYEVSFPSGISHFLEKLAFHVCLLYTHQYMIFPFTNFHLRKFMVLN